MRMQISDHWGTNISSDSVWWVWTCGKCGGVLPGRAIGVGGMNLKTCTCNLEMPSINFNPPQQAERTREGWICPKCNHGISPDVDTCPCGDD